MTYQFHPEAERELFDAVDYYEEREKDLGYDFSNEVYSAIQRILAHPQAWPFIAENIRRALLKRFPYGILYHYDMQKEQVFIVAVMHLHREPRYWQDRS
ncbi:type II toxin-antitoxin system RelE/ParE family toxin [Aliifodinibius sp. S!AR15-10]|uniref:type II toxin-antitoxin system RelE/ParE family toxin n=1 Tax=Aliifodinibius sp. S!AR15-10 TaxID=2950437 RepID=UPI00285EE8C4|nr:type II toxin-antitoxin system RelE/ParE family toxin [Aliifodinibius sp. S!AR15-10]MDR8389932.1 type II toxin-antitoxin system RelE/ParE family toxin [Aliifodinibius sp. S!AR15-10]